MFLRHFEEKQRKKDELRVRAHETNKKAPKQQIFIDFKVRK